MATLAAFKPPMVQNEPTGGEEIGVRRDGKYQKKVHKIDVANCFRPSPPALPGGEIFNQQNYAKGSPERGKLASAIAAFKKQAPLQIPLLIGGKHVTTSSPLQTQLNPSAFKTNPVAKFHAAGPEEVTKAIEFALTAKKSWETLPFADRAAIFLKAAHLISTKYRYELMAATIVGQGKNAWQAEIDAAAELCDFLRFNVQYAAELYAQQPSHNSPGVWNRMEYRPLEGFVYAVSPFNFTAIGGNLPAAPALMGNVVIWKPSPFAVAANFLTYSILAEAGLPHGVIQFVPGDAEQITQTVLDHRHFSALHFTGSTAVFRSLYGKIAQGVADSKYISYPRIVGETGGKNFHLIHQSADIPNAVRNTVRAAFEFQGQKCSACSRAYVPSSIWPEFHRQLIDETKAIKIGDAEDFTNFMGPVIHEAAFQKLSSVIDEANKDSSLELLVGGTYSDDTGYFIHPTIYATNDASHPILSTELFGPILAVHIYDDGAEHDDSSTTAKSAETAFESICHTIDTTSPYALTGAVFAQDRAAVSYAEDVLRNAAGNFYINCKCTGAVVGQQPFGGARVSGTNDKAGSAGLLSRFVSVRALKEEFEALEKVGYASNE
ncbi:1-pyrroline-5-carboxylate dehydrogenase [Paracoccidioides brasiliensis Pb18]|uniref:Multifunctional fusion protein n=1 Tax=Paracoccidioides brasiliensis (strain Pb18) TaxID=502780 RepID=C1G6U6_PARBD|nr:1-pyrroline-5-carboxylate dehydrogenase [Paracoccidioides brasiliensis Pb18]EEH46803.2 1-pyrroline-5-carboxylate dehydrogenase [Paracoccidioides brasiliensis Pb18]